jgi:exodeoxyribonuclease VII small subunit
MATKNAKKFEETLERLEIIIRELEEGNLSLEDSLSRYEEGVKMLKTCYDVLKDAERRIEILVKDKDGKLRAQTFEQEDRKESE